MENVHSKSVEETISIAAEFARKLKPHDVVVLAGNLGAGKTHFTKGLAKGLGFKDYLRVKSPTFTLVHEIEGTLPIIHFDLYRFNELEELFEIGFDEYLEKEAVCVIEWGDKFENYIPCPYYLVTFKTLSEETREIKWELVEPK